MYEKWRSIVIHGLSELATQISQTDTYELRTTTNMFISCLVVFHKQLNKINILYNYTYRMYELLRIQDENPIKYHPITYVVHWDLTKTAQSNKLYFC